MSDDDRPITKAEFDHYVEQLNAQVGAAIAKAARQRSPAANPAPAAADPAAWTMVQALQAEIRERDRAQLSEMRDEIRQLRDQPRADPLEEIESARALVAALGPEGDSQMMQGLGYLSNVAEAYIERSEKAQAAHTEASPDNAETVSQGTGQPGESHDPPEHPQPGSAAFADGGFRIIEETH